MLCGGALEAGANAVVLFSDDFKDNSLDTVKWNARSGGLTESGGTLNIVYSGATGQAESRYGSIKQDMTIETIIKFDSVSLNSAEELLANLWTSANGYITTVTLGIGGAYNGASITYACGAYKNNLLVTAVVGTYYTLKMQFDFTTGFMNCFIDGVQKMHVAMATALPSIVLANIAKISYGSDNGGSVPSPSPMHLNNFVVYAGLA